MHDRIFSLLVKENEISWRSIIFDLIKTNQMDPWDVDVSVLSQQYIDHLHKLQEQDLQVSGKVLLAAAILLRIKSNKLLDDDLSEFDRLLAGSDLSEEQFYDELEQELARGEELAVKEDFELIPKLPQARRRKVSVYDLVKALEKALEVKQRRILDYAPPQMDFPVKKFDITEAITSLYDLISKHISAGQSALTFDLLVDGKSKEQRVRTFIPLLHLCNQHKVIAEQEVSFGTINISLEEDNDVDQG